MSTANVPQQTDVSPSTQLKPLRSWVLWFMLPVMAIARFVPEWVEDGPAMIWAVGAFGPFLVGFGILLWWLFASRASKLERLLGFFGLVAILLLVLVLSDPTMLGAPTTVITIPMLMLGFAIATILFGGMLSRKRTMIALFIAFLFAASTWFAKTKGVWGNFAFELQWRWTETSEERLLAELKKAGPKTEGDAILVGELSKAEWPIFRGPKQDGAQTGCTFSDDWKGTPPKELWRITVGPAWSSFVVAGKYLFTQEQRGENEAVVCYDANTGKQLWEHKHPSRFFEALGGLGPRATPTLADGFVYALGAEGSLQKVDGANGKLVWKADVGKAAERTAPPMWGFSSSPLVYQDLVIVHAGGKGDKGILAFDVQSGELRWSAPAGEQSYASVQLATLLGKTYLLLLSDEGAHAYEPQTGNRVLNYAWPHMGYRALQPQVIDGDKLLIPTGMGTGTRLVQLAEENGALTGTPIWTSRDMKPDFNDVLVHQGYVYGFDNNIFGCIDLANGKRKWKGGRYEKGQALLLADSSLILVVSEPGELVLLRANPDKLEELAKLPAMDGKTWNHPVVVGNRLYLRNAEEAICYELAIKN